MNPDNIPYDLIDKYLNGELAPDHDFVKQVAQDKELSEEIEFQRLITSAVIDHRLLHVKDLLNKQKLAEVQPTKKPFKWLLVSIPIVLIGIGYSIMKSKNEKPEKIKINTTKIIENNQIKNNTLDLLIEDKTKNETKKIIVKKSTIYSTDFQKVNDNLIKISETQVNTTTQELPLIQSEFQEKDKHKEATSSFVKNVCEGVKITATINSEKPCHGTSSGHISIQNIKGGIQPYHFSIDNGMHFQLESDFTSLKTGDYQILIKDANSCISSVNSDFQLPAKSCVKFQNHSFNPLHETWEVPVNQEKAGRFTVIDKNGVVVYSRSFGISEQIQWNGSEANGQLLSPSAYVYLLEYQDGTVEKGNITLSY